MSGTGPELRIENLTVRFGGLVAVDGVSVVAPAGTVTGLIGPNGAGKTTTFNACCGVVRSQAGTIRLGDVQLDRYRTARRASLGLGRTFQRMDLFDSMTVEENVSLGPESMFAGRRPWSQLFATPREQADVRERTEHALATCGIQALRKRPTRDLSTGQRRLVELARAVASNFRFLLLDEPSSGLDVGETELLAETLVRYVSSTGIGLLLVEHDMSLVAAVCSYVYVLDFGKLIYSGTSAEILASQVVQAAYLGADFTIDPQGPKVGSHA